MKKTILLLTGLSLFILKNHAQTVIDYDGNVYNTVVIGTQEWMKENLKVTHYSNGEFISNISNNSAWSTLTSGARCYYLNDSINYSNVYGALYNWYAVSNSSNLCPTGWHIPSIADRTALLTYLGGSNIAGGKMKDTILWTIPNIGATNESGFTALPGGYRYYSNGSFNDLGKKSYFWNSIEIDNLTAWSYSLYNADTQVYWWNSSKTFGFSVGCIKDISNKINETNNNFNVNIYPNPAIDNIYINFIEKQVVKMLVYNIIGDCILQKTLNNNTNDIDISSLKKGIYIIKLCGVNGTVIHKITKL